MFRQQLRNSSWTIINVFWFEYFFFLDCRHVRSATVSMDNAGSTKREHAVSWASCFDLWQSWARQGVAVHCETGQIDWVVDRPGSARSKFEDLTAKNNPGGMVKTLSPKNC